MKTQDADNDSRVSLDVEFQKALRILEAADCLSDNFREFLEWAYARWNEGGGSYKDPPAMSRLTAILESSPWLDRTEAAAHLKFKDPKSIDRLRNRGILPEYYPGDINCPRFHKDDLDKIMNKREVKKLRSREFPSSRPRSTPVHSGGGEKQQNRPPNQGKQVTNR